MIKRGYGICACFHVQQFLLNVSERKIGDAVNSIEKRLFVSEATKLNHLWL